MPVARKHERIHQCSRCREYDEKDKYCVGGGKDIYEPMKLIYCIGFKPIKKVNGMDTANIKELISDIQGGGERLGEIKDHFPDDMKGSIAKQYWDDSTFTYGIEYGALIILNHLLEAEG